MFSVARFLTVCPIRRRLRVLVVFSSLPAAVLSIGGTFDDRPVTCFHRTTLNNPQPCNPKRSMTTK